MNAISQNNFNRYSFQAKSKSSRVVKSPEIKPYSYMAELKNEMEEERKLSQNAAKSLFNKNYGKKNTFKEMALICLPVIACISAIKIFSK